MKSVKLNRLLFGLAVTGACSLTSAQSLDAGATVLVRTPANNELRDSQSNSSIDGTRQTAVASKSDSSFLDYNPIIKGSATGSAAASAEYGVLKIFARSSGTGNGAGGANANAGFTDKFRIDGGELLNGKRGLINTKIEYQWSTGSVTDVTYPNNELSASLNLSGYTGNILAIDTVGSNGYSQSYIYVPNQNGIGQYLPQTFNIDITSEFIFGSWLNLSARLNGYTSAGGRIGSDATGQTIYQSSSAIVDAANSAYWGGISVFTIDGKAVANYGLESLSGTDWRQSFAPEVAMVPEPETYALMLAGLVAVGATARRRKAT